MKMSFPVPAQRIPGFSVYDSEDLCAGKLDFPPSLAPKLFAVLGIPLSREFPAPLVLETVFALSNQKMVYGFNDTLRSAPAEPLDQARRFLTAAEVLLDYVATLPAPQHLKLKIPFYGQMALQNLPAWKHLNWKRKQGPLSHRDFWKRWDEVMSQHLVEVL